MEWEVMRTKNHAAVVRLLRFIDSLSFSIVYFKKKKKALSTISVDGLRKAQVRIEDS